MSTVLHDTIATCCTIMTIQILIVHFSEYYKVLFKITSGTIIPTRIDIIFCILLLPITMLFYILFTIKNTDFNKSIFYKKIKEWLLIEVKLKK